MRIFSEIWEMLCAEQEGRTAMNFMQSQTRVNLARSFAGESQARNRYTFYAEQARKEGQEYIARIFETTAGNEQEHAEQFLAMLQKFGERPIGNIDIDAGYPYDIGNTGENLLFAAKGELDEHETAYPAFARTAADEGFAEIAQLWKRIAVIEGLHHRVFTETREQLLGGTLYQKSKPTVWRCMNCGYIYTANEPFAQCPVCKKERGWVEGYVDERNLPQG